MLALPGLIVVTACSFMGVGVVISFIRIFFKGGSFLGKPSARPVLFYSGKLSIFLSIGFILLKAIIPSFGGIDVPDWMSWLGAMTTATGSIIVILSFYSLNDSLKYGLPDEMTQLKTSGMFRYSRNPLYMGIFLVNLGSALFFPAIPNVLVSVYCIATHIILIKGEERFLAARFGMEWMLYTKKVRRFL